LARLVWLSVMRKHTTTFADVAEEVLQDVVAGASRARVGGSEVNGAFNSHSGIDERTVRRRVYDALNVLEAVGVIVSDKAARTISWRGLSGMVEDEAGHLEVCCGAICWQNYPLLA